MGGFGSSSWGGGPWGGSSAASGLTPVAIVEAVTLTEGVTVTLPLRLVGVVSLGAYAIEAFFSHNLDFTYPALLSTSNYTAPGLTISAVTMGTTPKSVRIITSEQASLTYTLTATAAVSTAGDPLGAAYHTASFSGINIQPTFFATAQSRTKITLNFSTAMLQNAAFGSASSYSVADLNGNAVAIVSATPSGPAPIQQVTLALGAELDAGGYYVVTLVSLLVQTVGGLLVYPSTDMFQWAEASSSTLVGPIQIAISSFSGEVSGGLLGQPLGQVFFSPALDVSAANSIIQVDEVSVCTRAYDVYTLPSIPDPNPLTTFGANQPYRTVLNREVLWASAARLGQARLDLADSQEETFLPPVEGVCTAVLHEVFDQTKVALLNVDNWVLFDGVGTSFICADNSAPVGPGATTTYLLNVH
jgi:hypothetical protein